MKEGRMRGQAFIKFPTVEQATQALNELHGYILHDKPMVIVSYCHYHHHYYYYYHYYHLSIIDSYNYLIHHNIICILAF